MIETAADPKAPAPPERRTQILRIGIGLVLATWVAFEPVLRSDFSGYTDVGTVTDGAHVGAAIARMLDLRLLGLDVRGQHAANLVLHVVNVLLLFGLLTRVTAAVWRSAAVAVLFGIHPLNVEPVAWVSERQEVLATSFGLLTLWAYAAYARRGGALRYLGTAALFSVGLATNPILVTLPLIFLLLDHWPLDRLRRGGARAWVEKLPFLALAAVAGAIALIDQRETVGPADSVPLPLRAANALVSYVRYAGKTLWPADLAVLYPHPNLPGGTPWDASQVVGAGLLLLGITWLATRRRYALVGWLWYLVTLVPVIGLVPLGPEAMADRYSYLPLVGLFVIAAWGGGELLAKIPSRRAWARRAAVACTLALLAVCIARTYVQALLWTNALTLYLYTLQVEPENPVIHQQLARIWTVLEKPNEAIEHYRRVLEFEPGNGPVRYQLAGLLLEQGEPDEAIDEYRRLLEIHPDSAEAHSNLGALLERRGLRDEAIEHYRRAVAARPDYPDALFNLGTALVARGEPDEAVDHYRRAIELRPGFAQAHNNLGNALLARGELDEAIAQYRAALDGDPEHSAARRNLATALELKEAPEPAP